MHPSSDPAPQGHLLPQGEKEVAVLDASKDSSPPREEPPQQLGRLGLPDAAIDLRRVVAGRLREEARAVLDRAALRVVGREIEAADAGERDRARAHRTRLERHVEVAADEAVVAFRARGLAQSHHLGMRRRIAVAAGGVAGGGDDRAVADDDGADRHLACSGRPPGLGEGRLHGVAPWRFGHVDRLIRALALV